MIKRTFLILPYLFSFGILLILFWACYLAIQHPDGGIYWSSSTGIISNVDPNGPAAGHLHVGDRIFQINGGPIHAARDLPGTRPGDAVVFSIIRNGTPLTYSIQLQTPSWWVIWNRVSIFILALSFWIPGLLVLALGRFQKSSLSFFFFHLGMSIILILGNISAYAPLWTGWGFKLTLWWIGPLVVDFHSTLLELKNEFKIAKKIWVLNIFALAFCIWDLSRIYWEGWEGLLNLQYIWVSANFLAAIALLFLALTNKTPSNLKQRVGIIFLGSIIGFSPFVLFSLLPEAVFGQVVIPYELAFLTLPIVPAAYTFAIYRYRFLKVERYVNQGAAYSLAIIILACFYSLIFRTSWHLFHNPNNQSFWLSFVITILLALIAHPLYLMIQRLVNRVFYGDWWNDQHAINRIKMTLNESGGDVVSVASILCQAIQKAMQLEYVNLCLIDGLLIAAEMQTENSTQPTLISIESFNKILSEFQCEPEQEFGRIDQRRISKTLHKSDFHDLLGPHPYAWILLKGFSGELGIAILGVKRGGGPFEGRDLEVLQMIIQQARFALENAFLNDELMDRNAQVEKLNRQVFQISEDERKRIARNLHDQTIQSLIGLNYKLAGLRFFMLPESNTKLKDIQREIRNITGEVRQICSNLRPTALDTLGLASALRSRIDEMREQVPFIITLQVFGDEKQEISEAIGICLYRVFQESLINVNKHSAAKQVDVALEIYPNEVILSITDDGKGFEPPSRIGSFAKKNHFGLVGLQEHLDTIHGELQITSSAGTGCKVTARVLLDNYEQKRE